MTLHYITRPLAGWDGPRTPANQRRSRYTFRASWGDTLDLLERELEHLDASDVVLEADFREQDLRMDGMPRSNARQPEDPAVRLAFDSRHGHLIYQADGYATWQHNIRAIALGLEALRAVDRYGITSRAQQYDGWRQIEAAPAAPEITDYVSAMRVIARLAGYTAGHGALLDAVRTDPDVLRYAYRAAARRAHPDLGGSEDDFDLLTRARTEIESRGLWPTTTSDRDEPL